MKKIITIMSVGLILAGATLPERAYAGGRKGSNRERNLTIATSALGGTLAGAVLGIFADRAFLVNSASAEQHGQSPSYSPPIYQQPAYLAPAYVTPVYPSDPHVTGYSEGYLEGLRQGRQHRYYEGRRHGYDDGYHAGLGW